MNIFKWLKDRGGKMALSALQTAGIATVVGVAGIGAVSFLGSSAEDPAGSPSSYNPGEVVYVAGAPTQGGQAGFSGYTADGTPSGGPNESSVRITAKTLNRIDQAETRERVNREMEEYASSNTYEAPQDAPSSGQGATGGMTEGLGMNANVVNSLSGAGDGFGGNPMAAMSGMMGNVQGMISQAQQGSAPGGKPEGGNGAAEGGKPQGLAGLKPINSSASGTGGGNNAFNSSFSIQNSGKNKGSQGVTNEGNGDALAQAQAQINSISENIQKMSSPSFGKSDGLGGSKDSDVSSGGRFGYKAKGDNLGMKDMKWIAARSNKAAMTNTRSNTEGARAFLSDEKVSGGMTFTTDNYSTGAGQGSKDYAPSVDASLRGLGAWNTDFTDESEQREQDRESMRKWFWIALGVAVAAAIAIPFIKPITIMGVPVGYWIALGLAAIASAFCAIGFMKALQYANTWGKSGFSTLAMVITPLLVGGVWASFLLSDSAATAEAESTMATEAGGTATTSGMSVEEIIAVETGGMGL